MKKCNKCLMTYESKECPYCAATKYLKLLKRAKIYFDWFMFECETDHIEGFELLIDELVKELDDTADKS